VNGYKYTKIKNEYKNFFTFFYPFFHSNNFTLLVGFLDTLLSPVDSRPAEKRGGIPLLLQSGNLGEIVATGEKRHLPHP
jgi:hypothetical protein